MPKKSLQVQKGWKKYYKTVVFKELLQWEKSPTQLLFLQYKRQNVGFAICCRVPSGFKKDKTDNQNHQQFLGMSVQCDFPSACLLKTCQENLSYYRVIHLYTHL